MPLLGSELEMSVAGRRVEGGGPWWFDSKRTTVVAPCYLETRYTMGFLMGWKMNCSSVYLGNKLQAVYNEQLHKTKPDVDLGVDVPGMRGAIFTEKILPRLVAIDGASDGALLR